ncbi:uncharacterized protein METZ01_LOCUS167574, partial [marine metagenome]
VLALFYRPVPPLLTPDTHQSSLQTKNLTNVVLDVVNHLLLTSIFHGDPKSAHSPTNKKPHYWAGLVLNY